MKKYLIFVLINTFAFSNFASTQGTDDGIITQVGTAPDSDGRPYLPIDNRNKESKKVWTYTDGTQNINVKLTDAGI